MNLLDALSEIVEKKKKKQPEGEDLLSIVKLFAHESEKKGARYPEAEIRPSQNMEIPPQGPSQDMLPPDPRLNTDMGLPQGPPRPPDNRDMLGMLMRMIYPGGWARK